MTTTLKFASPEHVTTHDVFGISFSTGHALSDSSDTRTDEQMESSSLPEDGDFDALDANE